jgi:cytoskeletal protein CcmA (bactofilin family)
VPGYAPSQPQGSSSSYNSNASSYNPGATAAARPASPAARNVACLGASLEVKGKISGAEDLQVDGKVEGPITLQGQRLTVGGTGQLASEVAAREVVVYGKLTGNIRASDRVEIKKDGSVIGDITTARISIEDGAYFKGRIEIERAKHQAAVEQLETVGAAEAN